MKDSLKEGSAEKTEATKKKERIDAAVAAATDEKGNFDRVQAETLLRAAQLIPEGVRIANPTKDNESELETFLGTVMGITFSDDGEATSTEAGRESFESPQ